MKKIENVSYQNHIKYSHCVSLEKTLSATVQNSLQSAEYSDPEAANSEAHALL